MIILIAFATFAATMLGGLFAIKLKDKLHLILGFSAGAVIAVAFFDLMPEAINLARGSSDVLTTTAMSSSTVLSIVALGFLIYLVLDRVILLHSHAHEDSNHAHVVDDSHDNEDNSSAEENGGRGFLGALTLCLHSLLDGIAIGLAFQVSTSIGAIVAAAVLTHDFSDGINTVNMIIHGNGQNSNVQTTNVQIDNNQSKRALSWLIIDAIAPVIGIIATMFFTLPESTLSIILALFAGFFLFIGASDLIPESQHSHPKIMTTIMTLVGAGLLYLVVRLAAI